MAYFAEASVTEQVLKRHLCSDFVDADVGDFESESFLVPDQNWIVEALPLEVSHRDVGSLQLLDEVVADVELVGYELLLNGKPRLGRHVELLVLKFMTSVR